tara:strand:+ start:569 stop:1066 length:498 start_codon:yes stop_codon:yes gene_type:complete
MLAGHEKEKKRAGIMSGSSLRVMYESGEDLASEAEIIDLIEKKWVCQSSKLAIKHQLDYLLLRNQKGVAWVEIKARGTPLRQYPSCMIAMTKIMAARALSETSKLPSFLVVRWSDNCGYIRIDTLLDFEISMGGRTDRGDKQDIEPVMLIPIHNFTELSLEDGQG